MSQTISAVPAPPLAARHILLVEDDRRITAALGIRLGASGHRLSHAADLDDAVEKMLAERPDVAVLDINLPDGNGLDLAARMRQLRATTGVPLVFITASRDPRHRERAEGLGIPLIEKPFGAGALLDTIDRVCRAREVH